MPTSTRIPRTVRVKAGIDAQRSTFCQRVSSRPGCRRPRRCEPERAAHYRSAARRGARTRRAAPSRCRAKMAQSGIGPDFAMRGHQRQRRRLHIRAEAEGAQSNRGIGIGGRKHHAASRSSQTSSAAIGMAPGRKGEQQIRRLRGSRSCAHDCSIVLTQHLEPGSDVIGMPDGRYDAERRAAERSRQFGNQFPLARIFWSRSRRSYRG